MKLIKTYRELSQLHTFEERFHYLDLRGVVGNSTFGMDRYLNQVLYHSREWRRIRDQIIIRDNACDLGILDREIFDQIIIHHLNPITMDNIERGDDCVYDSNNLICTSHNTHNSLHFGSDKTLIKLSKTRSKGDTKLW